MSWITWVLILTGVGLNAAAQLLLKVATRPLAQQLSSASEKSANCSPLSEHPFS